MAAGDPALDPHVARHEPAIAIHDPDGDGLGCFRALARAAPSFLAPGGAFLLEMGDRQSAAVAAIFGATGWNTALRADLAGIPRVRCATRPGNSGERLTEAPLEQLRGGGQ